MMHNDYISYFDAISLLTEKLGNKPSEAELWIWSFWGKDCGGIDAYVGSFGPDEETEFCRLPCNAWSGETDIAECTKSLIRLFFLRSEIEKFQPVRCITADELVKKWGLKLDSDKEAIIYIEQFPTEWSDFQDVIPRLRNQFAGANPSVNPKFEPLKGVYLLEDVLAIEEHCRMNEQKAEYAGDNGAESQADKESESTEVIQDNCNDIGFSGLLIIPSKVDDWYSVIDDMTLDFHNKFGKIPNKTQAWGALWTSPPEGYKITTDKDKGEECLKMPGTENLGKRAFIERWKKYTAKVTIKHFNPL